MVVAVFDPPTEYSVVVVSWMEGLPNNLERQLDGKFTKFSIAEKQVTA